MRLGDASLNFSCMMAGIISTLGWLCVGIRLAPRDGPINRASYPASKKGPSNKMKDKSPPPPHLKMNLTEEELLVVIQIKEIDLLFVWKFFYISKVFYLRSFIFLITNHLTSCCQQILLEMTHSIEILKFSR